MLLCGFLAEFWTFLRTARGSQWNYFVWCLLNAHAGTSCPPSAWNVPPGGCGYEPLRPGAPAPPLLLLTADGLSSPEAQRAFGALLKEAAAQRANHSDAGWSASLTLAGDPAGRNMSAALGQRGVLFVCDAAYDAHLTMPDAFPSCSTYCSRRRAELVALGATAVVCLLLGREAQDVVAGDSGSTRPELAYNFSDADVAGLLGVAAGVFVEGGSALVLLRALRRPLEAAPGGRGPSFGDLVRARVANRTLAYVGVSAGSIVAGETASVSLIWSPHGAKGIGWNFTGLRLVEKCAFLPHFQPKEEGWLERYTHDLRAGLGADPACPDCGAMGLPQCQPLSWSQAPRSSAGGGPGGDGGGTTSASWKLRYLCPYYRPAWASWA